MNDKSVDLVPGMTVRHALIAAFGELPGPEEISVLDSRGNLVGLDGALRDGDAIVAVRCELDSQVPS